MTKVNKTLLQDTFIENISPGEGIEIDLTNPTNPVISSNNFQGDSGIGGISGSVPAPAAGDAAAGKVLGAGGDWVTVASAVRGYLSGLTLSNNPSSPNTQIIISEGIARDDTNSLMLNSSGATVDFLAIGANGLDIGNIAANTTYHIFLIGQSGGTTAFLASLSPVAPTYPSGYTLKRRIGAILTNASSQILGFVQLGNEFLLKTIVRNRSNTAIGTTATFQPLTVPIGVQVGALVTLGLYYGSASGYAIMTSPDQDDVLPSAATGYNALVNSALSFSSDTPGPLRTNSSGQVRLRANVASITADIYTRGWVDYI